MKYIRETYGVPAKRGGRLEYMASDGELMEGTITGSAGPYLRVRLDGNKHSGRFHPTWRLKYLPDGPCFDDDGVGECHRDENATPDRTATGK
jgi:hypothetical protein